MCIFTLILTLRSGTVRYDGKVPHELNNTSADLTLHLVCVESITWGPKRSQSKPQSNTLRDVRVPLRDLTVTTIHPGHSVEFKAPALPIEGPEAWPDSFEAAAPRPGFHGDHRHDTHIRVQYFCYVGSKALAAKSALVPFKFYPAPSPTPSPPTHTASEDVQPPPMCFCKAERVTMELTMPTVVVAGKTCKVTAKCEGKAREVTFSLHQILTLREEGKQEMEVRGRCEVRRAERRSDEAPRILRFFRSSPFRLLVANTVRSSTRSSPRPRFTRTSRRTGGGVQKQGP